MQYRRINTAATEPTVEVKVRRTDPKLEEAIAEIKKQIHTYALCTIPNYFVIRDRHGMNDDVLMPALQESGYGFVKTTVVDPEQEQEVIVDLRYIAAAMLLIYSDRDFAKHNSVLKCLRVLHFHAWEAGSAVLFRDPLLREIYSAYGHHFSVMAIANDADLSTEDEDYIISRALRHQHPMSQLGKNDEELTAVYHLCLGAMTVANNNGDGYLPRRHFANPVVYKHFWRMAMKVIDQARLDASNRAITQQRKDEE